MEPEERRVGGIIGGKWRIDALLGSGSMAAVYAVTHRNGSRAALKILHGSLSADVAVCERFLGEGYLTNSVKHAGIVKVFDDGMTDDGCPFLAMDLLEGETLEGLRIRRGGKLQLDEALKIAEQIMDTLGAVHAAGIIHRDLKPQNVFVCNDGTVKLLDFGVARIQDRKSASKLSVMGMVLGTPSFMAPEQAMGSRDAVDAKSDIWAVGAIMFTLLTGETVHMAPTIQARLLAAATVRARGVRTVLPELNPDVALVIDTALQFKKEDRWENIAAMKAALTHVRQRTAAPKAAPESYQGSVTQVSAPPVMDDKTLIGMDSPSGTFESSAPPAGPLPAAGQPPPQRPQTAGGTAPPPSPNAAQNAALPPMRPQMGSIPVPTPAALPFTPGKRQLPPGVPVPSAMNNQASVAPQPQASQAPQQASLAPQPQASLAPQQTSVAPSIPQPFPPAPSAPGGSLPPAPPSPPPNAARPTSNPSLPGELTYPPPLDSSVDAELETALAARKRQRLLLSLVAAFVAAALAFGAVLVVKKGSTTPTPDPIRKTPGTDVSSTSTTSTTAPPREPGKTGGVVPVSPTAGHTIELDPTPSAKPTQPGVGVTAVGLQGTGAPVSLPVRPTPTTSAVAVVPSGTASAAPKATETAPTPSATTSPTPTNTAPTPTNTGNNPENPLW